MGTQKRQPGQGETKPETHRFLTAAEYFLRHRNFADCHKYALRARDSDLSHSGPTQILSIVSVLSASNFSSARHDYYTIFNLPRFESNAAQIKSSFKNLASILNPNANPYPFASEAFEVVTEAWSVLSDPIEKARFDDELRRNLSGCSPGSDVGTFWTMCPYCYYVYEYDKVYEECCLRCGNDRCRRVLHAVAIGAPPPPEVVEKGYYWCAGFMPLTIRNCSGEEMGENLWGPFGPPVGSTSKGADHKSDCNGEGLVIDISDDEDAEAVGEMGFQEDDANGSKTKIEGEASNSGERKDANGDRPGSSGENENGFIENSVKEMRVRRKKSVPWNSKKLMGRGFKIDGNQAHPIFGVGEEWPSVVDGNEGEDWEPGFGAETSNDFESGVEFFEGEDDILVGLQCDFDLEDGNN